MTPQMIEGGPPEGTPFESVLPLDHCLAARIEVPNDAIEVEHEQAHQTSGLAARHSRHVWPSNSGTITTQMSPCTVVIIHSAVLSDTSARWSTVTASTNGNATEAMIRLRLFQPLGSNARARRSIVCSGSLLTWRIVPAGTVTP